MSPVADNRKKVLIKGFSIFGVVTLVAILVAVIYNTVSSTKYQEGYKPDLRLSKVCPPYESYPLLIANCLGSRPGESCRKGREASFARAMKTWNDFAKEEGVQDLFKEVPYSDKENVVVVWRNSLLSEEKGRDCEEFNIAPDHIGTEQLGRADLPLNSLMKGKKRIHICLSKIDRGLRILSGPGQPTHPIRKHLEIIGVHGVLAHELGHILFGGETAHMDPHGSLMHSTIRSPYLAEHTKKILRKHLISPCKRSKLLRSR